MIVDTNVLIRAWAGDDERQAQRARSEISAASTIVVSNVVLCEFVWTARKVYRQKRGEIARAIHLLLADERIVADWPAVEAGLAFLEAGGDFADGIIEFEGRKLGGEVLVTFDKRAVSITRANGRMATLLNVD